MSIEERRERGGERGRKRGRDREEEREREGESSDFFTTYHTETNAIRAMISSCCVDTHVFKFQAETAEMQRISVP